MTGSTGRCSIVFRVARTVVLVAIAGGCDKSCDPDHRIGDAVVLGIGGGTHGAKPAKFDHILQIRTGKNDTGLTFRPNRELWKPFRLEASLGLPDANHADLGTSGSFGVSVVDTPRFVFYTFDVKRSGAGIVVTAGAPGLTPSGTLTIPDSLAADVAIEDTGTLVIFSARKYGDPAYVTLGSVPVTRAGPYQLSLDASGIPKGTVIGYDLARLTANGMPPFPSAAQTARETIYTAIDAMVAAMYAIDGDTPDRKKAGDQLDLAVTRLDAALALDLTPYKNAQKNVASARKKTAKLVAGARGTKSANSVIASLISTAKVTGLAADAVQ